MPDTSIKQAYTQLPGDQAGSSTFVSQTSKNNRPGNTGKPSKDNGESRQTAPEHKETALPLPSDRSEGRERHLENPNGIGFNGPPAFKDAPDGKPLHEKTRTKSKPGEESGNPVLEQGDSYKQRRPDITASAPSTENRTSHLAQKVASAYFLKMAGYKSPSVYPLHKQKEQTGEAKLYSKHYYKENKSHLLPDAKRRYKRDHNNKRLKIYKHTLETQPNRFERQHGGVSDPAARSKKYREQHKDETHKTAKPMIDRQPAADMSQTWLSESADSASSLPKGNGAKGDKPVGHHSWQGYGPDPKNEQNPGHTLDTGTVEGAPGSSKYIPPSSEAVNKPRQASMRMDRLATIVTATKIAEIERNVKQDIVDKARDLTCKLVKVDKTNRLWLFDVQGSEPKPYRVRVQVKPSAKNLKAVSKMDVLCSCDCPFWRWQGPEYHAQQNQYLYGEPVGTASKPAAKDPDGQHWLCKHLSCVLQKAKRYTI